MKRLEYGAYKLMTPEQKAERRRALQKEWRAKNKDVVSRNNHYWYERYRERKPFIATCIYCGKQFNATRNYYKTCPECMDERHLNYMLSVQERKLRIEKRKQIYEDILDLRSQGLAQTKIADILGISQSTVSYIIRTRGTKKGGNNE